MQPPEAVTAVWDQAVAAWDEPKRHEAVLALVAQHRCYAWAAGQYKQRAGDPIADAQLERLRKAATAQMLATATAHQAPEKTPYRSSIVVLVVLVILMVIGAAYAWVRDRQAQATHAGEAPPAESAH